jgi:hypothetical protein
VAIDGSMNAFSVEAAKVFFGQATHVYRPKKS